MRFAWGGRFSFSLSSIVVVGIGIINADVFCLLCGIVSLSGTMLVEMVVGVVVESWRVRGRRYSANKNPLRQKEVQYEAVPPEARHESTNCFENASSTVVRGTSSLR